MQKLVVLKSTGGDFGRGFVFTVSIADENQLTDFEEIGQLPADLQLEQYYQEWKQTYADLGLQSRLFTSGKSIRKATPLQDCQQKSDRLKTRFNQWLRSELFLPIRDILLSEVKHDHTVRFVIQVDHLGLQQLPWSLWDLLDRYPKAEISIAAPTFQRRRTLENSEAASKTNPVRILAILGDSTGIKIDRDRKLLDALPHAEVLFLVEPQRQDLADHLWEQPWDILFFAGHSITQQEKGYLYLNQTDRISIDDLKYVLKRAVDRGLKLGIFNSCDGFGLARALADLHIPQTIFMREPVPDRVAQIFLQYFLASFSQGETLYLSVRNARERLRTLETIGEIEENANLETSSLSTAQPNPNPTENPPSTIDDLNLHELDSKHFGVFPCASWLPLIFQNLAENPPTWKTLQNLEVVPPNPQLNDTIELNYRNHTSPVELSPIAKALQKWSIAGTLALSLGIGTGVCWVRSQGWLQGIELRAYDHVMQMRSIFQSDAVDERLLVVTIDDVDAEIYKNPNSDLSLSNEKLLALLTKLREAKAKVIGLDLIRDSNGVDQKIVRSLKKMDNVVGVCINNSRSNPGVKPPQGLEHNIGFADMAQDSPEGSIRRHLLALPLYPESPCQTPSSFSLALAAQYLGQSPSELLKQLPILNGADRPGSYYKFKERDSLDPKDFPHLMINYRNAKIPTMTVSDFLQGRGGNLDLSRRIVVIGNMRITSTDSHPIPLTKPLSHATSKELEGRTAGVWIQAEKAGYLVNLIQKERSAVWIPEERWAIGLILLAAILGGGLMKLGNSSKSHIFSLNSILILIYGSTIVAFIQFTAWIPLVPLLIATIASAGITAAVQGLYLPRDSKQSSLSSGIHLPK